MSNIIGKFNTKQEAETAAEDFAKKNDWELDAVTVYRAMMVLNGFDGYYFQASCHAQS